MPKGQAPAPKKPEKDFGEKIRAKMDSMRGPTERMGKRIQEAFPAISNKFKEKAAADATKGKPSARKSPTAAKPTSAATKRSVQELRDMKRKEAVGTNPNAKKPVPLPMAKQLKRTK